MKMRLPRLSFHNTKERILVALNKSKATMHQFPRGYFSSEITRARACILPISYFNTVRQTEGKLMQMIHPMNVSWSQKNHFSKSQRHCDVQNFVPNKLSETQYEALAEETLHSLQDFFDTLPDVCDCTDEYDSEFGNGVLTIHFSKAVGTYVINKQTPNKQIWLSSPKTGPKRYDFCGNRWIYRHDGVGLHHLLEEEMSEILGSKVSLKDCKHYS